MQNNSTNHLSAVLSRSEGLAVGSCAGGARRVGPRPRRHGPRHGRVILRGPPPLAHDHSHLRYESHQWMDEKI